MNLPDDGMLNDLETKAIEAGFDLLFKQLISALRSRRFWQRPRVGRIVRTWGAKLDDLILDLQPCFAVGKGTSIYETFHLSSATKDESWNQTHYLLHAIGAWFHAWDDMRQAIGTRRTLEILVRQFESLNGILIQLGYVALPDVSRRFASLAPEDYALVSFRAMANRYNHFLTEYEALLRRLPQEAGLNPLLLHRPCFFTRL